MEQVATGEGFEGAVDPLRLQRLQANLHQKMYSSDMKRVDDELKDLEDNVEMLRADVINRRIKVKINSMTLKIMLRGSELTSTGWSRYLGEDDEETLEISYRTFKGYLL